jgi:hypothetical protein
MVKPKWLLVAGLLSLGLVVSTIGQAQPKFGADTDALTASSQVIGDSEGGGGHALAANIGDAEGSGRMLAAMRYHPNPLIRFMIRLAVGDPDIPDGP